jgi:hypothetical protein
MNANPNSSPKASISGAIRALAPEPPARTTLVLSITQRGQAPSKNCSAAVRKALASKRVKRG